MVSFQDVIEIAPYPHKFDYTESYCGGGFSKASDAQWFYRYDTNLLEVRDVDSCHSEVFASLDVKRLAEDELEELDIACVTDALINEEQYLIVGTKDVLSSTCKMHLFNPLTLEITTLPFSFTGNISAMAISKDFAYESSVYGTCVCNLLVIGLTDSKVLLYQFFSYPNGGQCIDFETTYRECSIPKIGMITALAVYTPSQFEDTESYSPVIIVGSGTGKIEAFRYTGERKSEIKPIIKISGQDHPGAVTSLVIKSIDGGQFKHGSTIFLFAGYGTLGKATKSPSRPVVDIYQIRLSTCEYRQLGKVKSNIKALDQFSGGIPQAVSCVEENDCYYLISSFLNRMSNKQIRSELVVSRIHGSRIEEVLREDIGSSYAELLLDIFPQKGSLECSMLFLNKIGIYVGLSDIKGENMLISDMVDYPEFDRWFDLHPDSFPYSAKAISQICSIRDREDGILFVDHLLEFAGLQVGSLYPPQNATQLKELVSAVLDCELDILKKHCILYYFLKDYQDATLSERYASHYLIPSHFQSLLNGYWCLDHDDHRAALTYLADPSVEADWASKIVKSFYKNGYSSEALEFIQMTHPLLEEEEDVLLQMNILLKCDLAQAFAFQRSVEEADLQGDLLHLLFEFCFSEEAYQQALGRLLHIPLLPREEAYMIEVCSSAKNHIAQDYLVMYYIHHGRYVEAIKAHTRAKYEESYAGGSVRKSVVDREVIIDNLKLVLPEIQRNILALELAQIVPGYQADSLEDDDIEMVDINERGSTILSKPQVVESISTQISSQVAPLSAAKSIRQTLPQLNSEDGVASPQTVLIKALMKQMIRKKATIPASPLKSSSVHASSPFAKSVSSATPKKEKQVPRSVQASSPFSGPPSTPQPEVIQRIRESTSPQLAGNESTGMDTPSNFKNSSRQVRFSNIALIDTDDEDSPYQIALSPEAIGSSSPARKPMRKTPARSKRYSIGSRGIEFTPQKPPIAPDSVIRSARSTTRTSRSKLSLNPQESTPSTDHSRVRKVQQSPQSSETRSEVSDDEPDNLPLPREKRSKPSVRTGTAGSILRKSGRRNSVDASDTPGGYPRPDFSKESEDDSVMSENANDEVSLVEETREVVEISQTIETEVKSPRPGRKLRAQLPGMPRRSPRHNRMDMNEDD
ncbi:hypothetical protein K493DRAFT_320353 [Basidiobolus meristosporus CBS 931.73]|uniref:ELYS-like domain-containing protein n=1 Tax=Basidiobolus meristosporus CBS 931.73 TaxID=1314790 RepID=A0A1Y1XBV3_9FUNG|nr:hypothetical protein K493DRAFT_320353 [Basidiobolus meristosporus CBS 931.73]|eukprot:ORX82896.1 hypothetical protein K493DRAFT_320353 [Basidiobolus meristosporus CBS 931.73]